MTLDRPLLTACHEIMNERDYELLIDKRLTQLTARLNQEADWFRHHQPPDNLALRLAEARSAAQCLYQTLAARSVAIPAVCAFCGTNYERQRTSSKFCSGQCRQAAFREAGYSKAVKEYRHLGYAVRNSPPPDSS